MYIDNELLFSEDQTITADAASTSYIDLEAAHLEAGNPIKIYCKRSGTTAATGFTSIKVSVQTSSASDFSSATTLQEASLTLSQINEPREWPLGILNGELEQYLRLYYDVTGTGSCVVTAGLVIDSQTNT